MQFQIVSLIKESQTHKTLINHEVSRQHVCICLLKTKQLESFSLAVALLKQFRIAKTNS